MRGLPRRSSWRPVPKRGPRAEAVHRLPYDEIVDSIAGRRRAARQFRVQAPRETPRCCVRSLPHRKRCKQSRASCGGAGRPKSALRPRRRCGENGTIRRNLAGMLLLPCRPPPRVARHAVRHVPQRARMGGAPSVQSPRAHRFSSRGFAPAAALRQLPQERRPANGRSCFRELTLERLRVVPRRQARDRVWCRLQALPQPDEVRGCEALRSRLDALSPRAPASVLTL